MSKRFRLLLIMALVVICGIFLAPTIKWYFFTSPEMKNLAASSRTEIRDYSHNLAVENETKIKELLISDPTAALPDELAFLEKEAKANYKLAKMDLPSEWTVSDVALGFRDNDELIEVLEAYYRDDILDLKSQSGSILQLGLDLSGGMSVQLRANLDAFEAKLGHSPSDDEVDNAMSTAMEIMTSRIDSFGLTEPQIRRQGTDSILIDVPGVSDPEIIESFVQEKSGLNFHIEDEESTAKLQTYLNEHSDVIYDENHLPIIPDDILPVGGIIRGQYKKDQYGIDQFVQYLVLFEEIGLEGSHIMEASVANDSITNKPRVSFFLDSEGGDIFFNLTSNNVDNILAVVLNGQVKAGARISEPIRDQVSISGFGETEAYQLATILRTAEMPLNFLVENMQDVGASMGEDAIQAGLRAIGLGFLLVILFMAIYYKSSGLVADLALITNLFIIIAILSAFHMTLTMTSIASLILTVGMAVDANVIIFERIKEELSLGKSRAAAINAGFKKAFWTVMDANITTFIAAIFLSQLGSGPIQGFAVALTVGIISSMFTALFMSRLLFDTGTEAFKKKTISIGWGIK